MRAGKSPLLFLDIDGVMNTRGSIMEHKSNRVFTPKATQCLGRIAAETGCSLVISSTWREEGQRQLLPGAFRDNGLEDLVARIIGTTPILDLADNPTREDEIDCWLFENEYCGRFAILDDEAMEGELASRLVQTDPETGLTEKECEAVIALLGRRQTK